MNVIILREIRGFFLLVAFQRRYDPTFVKLKQVVEQGGIGTLQKVLEL